MARVIDILPEDGVLRLEFGFDRELIDHVKKLPERRFDPNDKNWYVPIDHLETVVAHLRERHFKLSPALREYCKQNDIQLGDSARASSPQVTYLPTPPQTVSISDLNRAARRALRRRFDSAVWVVGEVQSYERNSAGGHAYFELVERLTEDQDPCSRISVVAFRQHRERIESKLAGAGNNIQLRDGLKVRVKGRVDLYEPSGKYQLKLRDVDPAYTTGELHQKRRRILNHLDELGIREVNLDKPWPECPLQVGLITSYESDAYSDFASELLRFGTGFQLTVYDAKMQGEQTEASVLSGLEYFADRARDFDVVAIVRGGGARSDLAYFDTEAIGEAICRHPLKIVSGIGHQRDRCLVDFIAESQKTPTAAAQAVVKRVRECVERLDKLQRDLIDSVRQRLEDTTTRLGRLALGIERHVSSQLERAFKRLSRLETSLVVTANRSLLEVRSSLDRQVSGLRRLVRNVLERQATRVQTARTRVRKRALIRYLSSRSRAVERLSKRLRQAVERRLDRDSARLDHLEKSVELLSPARVLERGYARIWSDGEVVSTPDDVQNGEVFDVELSEGAFGARRLDDERDHST